MGKQRVTNVLKGGIYTYHYVLLVNNLKRKIFQIIFKYLLHTSEET